MIWLKGFAKTLIISLSIRGLMFCLGADFAFWPAAGAAVAIWIAYLWAWSR